jgi:putative DNA primase/helicase
MHNSNHSGRPDNCVDLRRLIEGLGARSSGRGWAARCPAHEDRNPSLSITQRDGRVLVHCFSGCEQTAVLEELQRRDLWPRSERREHYPHRATPLPRRPAPPVDTGMRDFGLRLWAEASTLCEGSWPSVLVRYFQFRGLEQFEPCARLRLHPRMPHGGGRFFPALLALATDISDEPTAVQATYLSEDGSGKAPVEPARKTFGSATGCAVHLLEGDDVLIVGEGVESALSAMQVLGEGGFALLGTNGFKSISLPAVYCDRRVLIAADNDASGAGQNAACEAARRLVRDQGFGDVRIVTPPRAGTDFNDRLRSAA